MADFNYKGIKKLKFDPKKLKRFLKQNLTGTEIATKLEISEATLYRYLRYLKQLEPLAKMATGTEATDLAILGARARHELTERMSNLSDTALISLMDKAFKQNRLLSGKSTENVAVLTKIIDQAHANIRKKYAKNPGVDNG